MPKTISRLASKNLITWPFDKAVELDLILGKFLYTPKQNKKYLPFFRQIREFSVTNFFFHKNFPYIFT